MRTHGQLVDEKAIKFTDFFNQVSAKLKQIGIKKYSCINIKKEFNKGKTVDDTCSFMILNSN